ncbi:hypothetical protein HII31_07809 [Pseudocercospora fuligena]|uniref:Inheritance of peroxisomes protein 1 n=1 Tax=Pseudocercospora fuligena TaxID=685502 RepID=A0A8H6RF21_9PEZI|nr:hypothetical protein HII31_07809 [Pseudocercospora fuligena]
MSSTAPPTTPARKNTVTRSFTIPTAKRAASTGAAIGETEGVETLFVHPNTKVIRFTSSSRPGSSAGTPSPGGRGQGTLPWATNTEKTMAAGPLEIYRVPGSVSFLHSGALLHTIMPRSNCWCVDGVSKFAMRVLPDTYYRIELPGETPEDLEKVEELKVTFAKVLFYERTACPFARTFSVDLPEEEEIKPKKRRRRTDGPAKKWKLDKAYSWRPEGWTPDQDRPSDESSGSQTATDEEGSSSSTDDQVEEAADQVTDMKITTPSRPSVRDRAKGFNLRSVTAPPQMSLQSTPPSRLRTSFLADDNTAVSERSDSQSRDLHTEAGASREQHRTLQAIFTDMPPSPPDSSAGFEFTSPNPSSRRMDPEQSSSEQSREELEMQPPHVSHAAEMVSAISTSTASSSQGNDMDAAAITRPAADPDQLEEKPGDPGDHIKENDEAESTSTLSEPLHVHGVHGVHEDASAALPKSEAFVKPDPVIVTDDAQAAENAVLMHDQPLSQEPFDVKTNSRIASLPSLQVDGADLDQLDKEPSLQEAEEPDADNQDSATVTTEHPAAANPEEEIASLQRESVISNAEPDPYAQIQARIQARRTIGSGVTTGFEPLRRQTTRQSSSSTASSRSLRSSRSRRGRPADLKQDQALAAGLVRKAYDVFLGPPAHLIAIMLKIAARFARGTFRNTLLYESPPGMKKHIPGSFDLDGSDVEFLDESEDDGSAGEDDFGVPLRSPIRMMSSEAVPRQLASPSIKERRGWQLET